MPDGKLHMTLVGIYIGNIFNEIKNRKSYFIQEILNGEEREKVY